MRGDGDSKRLPNTAIPLRWRSAEGVRLWDAAVPGNEDRRKKMCSGEQWNKKHLPFSCRLAKHHVETWRKWDFWWCECEERRRVRRCREEQKIAPSSGRYTEEKILTESLLDAAASQVFDVASVKWSGVKDRKRGAKIKGEEVRHKVSRLLSTVLLMRYCCLVLCCAVLGAVCYRVLCCIAIVWAMRAPLQAKVPPSPSPPEKFKLTGARRRPTHIPLM